MILQSMGDAVVCTDAACAITFLNAKAEYLTAWNSGDANGVQVTRVLALSNESDQQSFLNPVRDCLDSGETMISERGTILTGKDGVQRHIGFSVALVRNPAGDRQGTVLVFNDISLVCAEERKLAHTASHDALTGLPNRLSFLSTLSGCMASAKRERDSHCLCFVDLDRFKQVNDTGGHAAGDAVLKEVAQIILKTCPADHVAARLGGDEFAVLMPNCGIPQGEWTANRLIRAIRKTEFRHAGETYRVGASIGATAIDLDSPELSEVLHQADMACYAAKERGRNRLSVYNGKRRTAVGDLSAAVYARGR